MNTYIPNQNDIIHETSVDFVLRPCTKEIHIVQYDKSLPVIKVELFRNGERYVLPENAAVNVRVGKLDHTFVYSSILGTNEERNVVYFEISYQMTTIPGRIWPVLEVIENAKVACSSPLCFIIECNPIQEGQIESHDDFPIIYELQGTVADHGNRITTLESSIVVSGEYDNDTKSIILTLQNGNTITIPVSGLISGLATTTDLENGLSTKSNATNLENGIGNNSIQQKGTVASAENAFSLGKDTISFSKTSHAQGYKSKAGCKGYFWVGVDFENKYLYLSETQSYPIEAPHTEILTKGMFEVGDVLSITNYNHYDLAMTITEVSDNRIKVDNIPFDRIIDNTPGIVPIEYDVHGNPTTLGHECIEADGGEDYFDSYSVFCVAKPTIGSADFGRNSYAESESTEAIGRGSHAEGDMCKSLSGFAHTEGRGCEAYYNAHAEGHNTLAIGVSSHAEGYLTKATGQNSHAEGRELEASGQCAHAEGYKTTSSAMYSHSEGQSTIASSQASHAEGASSKATADRAHAEGFDTTASGNASHAEGRKTIASGDNSHAGGVETIASQYAQTAIGRFNSNNTNTLFEVGNGTDSSSRSNAFEVHKDGHAEIKLQGTSNASVVRLDTVKTYAKSLTMDSSTYVISLKDANGNVLSSIDLPLESVVVGGSYDAVNKKIILTLKNGATIEIPVSSLIEGLSTATNLYNGEASNTLAQDTCHATGQHAFAIGNATIASSACAHSEGLQTLASGERSHAEGFKTVASGNASHAEGRITTAIGDNSHTEGVETSASGYASHAEGHKTIANNKSEHASGQFNISHTNSSTFGDSGNTLYSIGNGSSDSNRKNAFEVFQDGHAEIQAVGTTSNSVITKDYVDTIRINLDERLSLVETNFPEIFTAEYGVTTITELNQALTDGKKIFVHYTGSGEEYFIPLAYVYGRLSDGSYSTFHFDTDASYNTRLNIVCNNGTWSNSRYQYARGCLIEGTKITMADNSVKNIEDVQVGDLVKSYNPKTKQMCEGVVILNNCLGSTTNFRYDAFSDGSYIVTALGHSLLNMEENKERPMDLDKFEPGYKCLNDKGEIVDYLGQIGHNRPRTSTRYFDILVSSHTYFANGICNAFLPSWRNTVFMDSCGYNSVDELPSDLKEIFELGYSFQNSERYQDNEDFIHEMVLETLNKTREPIRRQKELLLLLADTDYKVIKAVEKGASPDPKDMEARQSYRDEINDIGTICVALYQKDCEIRHKYFNMLPQKDLDLYSEIGFIPELDEYDNNIHKEFIYVVDKEVEAIDIYKSLFIKVV